MGRIFLSSEGLKQKPIFHEYTSMRTLSQVALWSPPWRAQWPCMTTKPSLLTRKGGLCVCGSPFPEGPLPLASEEQEIKACGEHQRKETGAWIIKRALSAARFILALASHNSSEKLDTRLLALHPGGRHAPPYLPGLWSCVRPLTILRPQSDCYQMPETYG